MQQSSVTDPSEETPAVVTKDTEDKVGIFNYPLLPACICVLYLLLFHSQLLKKVLLTAKKEPGFKCKNVSYQIQ